MNGDETDETQPNDPVRCTAGPTHARVGTEGATRTSPVRAFPLGPARDIERRQPLLRRIGRCPSSDTSLRAKRNDAVSPNRRQPRKRTRRARLKARLARSGGCRRRGRPQDHPPAVLPVMRRAPADKQAVRARLQGAIQLQEATPRNRELRRVGCRSATLRLRIRRGRQAREVPAG